MTVAGISSVIATAVVASIGDISRFDRPEKLASYFGLTRVYDNLGIGPPSTAKSPSRETPRRGPC